MSLLLQACSTPKPGGTARKAKAKSAKDLAAEISPEAMEKEVKSSAHYATGIIFDLSEKPDEALDHYWKAAEENPQYEPLVLEVARRMIRGKKPDKAIEILSRSSKNPNASGMVHAWLGLAYAQTGKNELAIAANRTAIKKSPYSLPAYQNLAQIYLQNSQTNEALRVLDEAANQPEVDASFLVDVAELFSRFGRLQVLDSQQVKPRVVAALDRAAKLGSKNPFIQLKLADGYLGAGEPQKAEELYGNILKEEPDMPGVREKLAELYLRNGKREKAAEQLQAIAKANPTNPQTYIFLAGLAMENKAYDEASDHLGKAILLNPDLEQAYYELAGLKITLKKPGEALDLLEKARGRFRLNFLLEFYAGVANAILKNYNSAIKNYIAAEIVAKATDPSKLTHHFYYQFGSAYERNGEIEEAEKQFEKALEISPKYADALNYLGYMWAERGIKLERARQLIEQAVELEPKNAAFLDSLAWVLFKLNKPQEALSHMLKAIEHSEEPDPTLYDHLGDIYAALRQFEPARDAWKKSLAIEGNEQVDAIKKKLEALTSTDRTAP
ncbi:MAG: tetratricopeptide repeat protein [Verrucomicrobiota bacterium]